MAMTISIIIPVLHEEDRINGIISQLEVIAPETEIIVVDGNTGSSTIAAIIDPKVIRITAPQGRGIQLATGAAIATGDILLLLHADTSLPDNGLQLIIAAITEGADWGAFRLGINAPGILFRIIEKTVTLRCKLFTLPYGDQAMFVTRSALQQSGGIPAIPLMEDVALARRLAALDYKFLLVGARVVTSARRWQKEGTVQRTLRNWWLLLRYLWGANPADLAKEYR